jgi:putative sterol carrier protein
MVEGHVPQGMGVQVPPSALSDTHQVKTTMQKAIFPTSEWVQTTKEKFNSDEKYAQIAKNWEGDLRLILEPDGPIHEPVWIYWDLWHGTCRDACVEDQSSTKSPALVIKAPYQKFVKVLSGEMGVMQALMGRVVQVQGSMILIMRNVPTVLDFVRCCQEVTSGWL